MRMFINLEGKYYKALAPKNGDDAVIENPDELSLSVLKLSEAPISSVQLAERVRIKKVTGK